MSIKTSSQTIMKFGIGDIGVSVSYEDKELTSEPFIMFHDIEPGIIGDRPEQVGKEILNWTLVMYFDKPESVDSVIDVLKKFKEARFSDQKN